MNNLKNNIRRTPRQLARREPARSCEPSSHELSSQLSSLFPYRLSVTDGDTTRTYTYHADGQLATANYGRAGAHPALSPLRGSLRSGDMRTPQTETFLWDGLSLVKRGDEQFINEPHVGGGNPVASSKGTSYFNDALGTTVGAKKDGKYSAVALTAFGEDLSVNSSGESSRSPFPVPHSPFFTGKPFVDGLGHAFLMRNYRAGLAKWQTADPMGYPDGWNQLAYCNNGVTSCVDYLGCGLVADEIRETVLAKLENSVVSDYVDKLFKKIGDSGKPDYDLLIHGSINITIKKFDIYYKHGIIFDTEGTSSLPEQEIPVSVYTPIPRTEPDVYTKRDPEGDSIGPGLNNLGIEMSVSIPSGLDISCGPWYYPVTITGFAYTITCSVDLMSRFMHFVQE